MVVHENHGLNPHIEDVTRRIALENFVAFAPDALFPLGGYPGDEDKARSCSSSSTRRRSVRTSSRWRNTSSRCPTGNGKLGVVGFCYGGGMSNISPRASREIDAAVPFYGSPPPPADAA